MNNASVETTIVIPARNEEKRIGTCLAALLAQCRPNVRIIVVLNNTSDGTEAAISCEARKFGKPVDLLTLHLPPEPGGGTARRLGCAHAIDTFSNLRFLLTTDADGIAAPDWLARNLAHLDEVDAVCGAIEPIPAETTPLSGQSLDFAVWEGRYRRLVLDWYYRFAPETANPQPHHGEASGASLAIRLAAYRSSGGFDDVKTGEDRAIVRQMKSRGFAVRHAGDVVMQASCRLTGRAPDGMAAALRDRLPCRSGPYGIDTALPCSDWLLENMSTPGVWPPDLPPEGRLRVNQLPYHISALEHLLADTARGGAVPTSIRLD
ncbi:MAG: glycosyltransferase [Rhodobacterales bacterium]